MTTSPSFEEWKISWKLKNGFPKDFPISSEADIVLREQFLNTKETIRIISSFAIAIPWGMYDEIMRDIEAEAWARSMRIRLGDWTSYYLGYNVYYLEIFFDSSRFTELPLRDDQIKRRDKVMKVISQQVRKYNIRSWGVSCEDSKEREKRITERTQGIIIPPVDGQQKK